MQRPRSCRIWWLPTTALDTRVAGVAGLRLSSSILSCIVLHLTSQQKCHWGRAAIWKQPRLGRNLESRASYAMSRYQLRGIKPVRAASPEGRCHFTAGLLSRVPSTAHSAAFVAVTVGPRPQSPLHLPTKDQMGFRKRKNATPSPPDHEVIEVGFGVPFFRG